MRECMYWQVRNLLISPEREAGNPRSGENSRDSPLNFISNGEKGSPERKRLGEDLQLRREFVTRAAVLVDDTPCLC
ncbi:hypothetical protein DEO72_LG5g2837 [Vigna unguiculata]|uniref:Uncharacterized protein n=1 Tax=Vigna unguiculata TaxID=3917 RepID=A0A4D6M2G7_VIGUN|nr:hypothetical protein DEO72_LG5g2837 [Vigna unguiculata]